MENIKNSSLIKWNYKIRLRICNDEKLHKYHYHCLLFSQKVATDADNGDDGTLTYTIDAGVSEIHGND